MYPKFKVMLSISIFAVLLLFFSVFWYLQSSPFLDGQDFQKTLVTYQGFFHMRYITGYYLMLCLPILYIVLPDVKSMKLVRYQSRLAFYYQRLSRSFLFGLGFSVMLCVIVGVGTSLFFDVRELANQHFYLALLFQAIQFSFVYGIIFNLSNILVDIFDHVMIGITIAVVLFILLTEVIYFRLNSFFFFADVPLVSYVINDVWTNSLFFMRIIRMCGVFIISAIISRYIFLLRDIK